MKIFGYEISKKQAESKTEITVPEDVKQNFNEYMDMMKRTTGQDEVTILKNTFSDGFLTLTVEESANLRLDAQALLGSKSQDDKTEKDPIKECIRLRKKFGPVSTCVDYVKQQLTGGGLDTLIKDSKNVSQKKMKEELDIFLETVYQDDLTIGMKILLPIIIDYALTTGVGAAEIAYLENKTFWDYAKVKPVEINIDNKPVKIIDFEIIPVKWNELKGIKRLKIFPNGYKLFEPKRNNLSMEIEYWNVVNANDNDKISLSSGEQVNKYDAKNPKAGLYLHGWQLFYLALNRKESTAKGESIIIPVIDTAQILERIMQSVGEGYYRAGNKKFFIIMGSEKRPWGGPFIRNVLQQMKEAKNKNTSVIPMPQGFDIKEMGGEVFDGKEVVDYFLKIIARGMNCPVSILGVEQRNEMENLATYDYSTMKDNLISALHNQLFKRHIWAKHGKTRTIQGGGSEEVFIPYPRIKVEDLLTLNEKTELFKQLMNFANPLDPLIKHKVQIEYCQERGWMDVIEQLPTIEEKAKEIEEQKELLEKQQEAKAKAPMAPFGEKAQGQPKPPSEEQLKKRQAGGVNIRPVDSKKGKIESKVVEETEAVDIPYINEPQRVEITVNAKSEPQKVILETKPQEITVKSQSPLDSILQELAKAELAKTKLAQELIEKQQLYADETDKETRKKIALEIEEAKSRAKAAEYTVAEMELQLNKLKVETEEIKKTHEAKRKTIQKIKDSV